MESSEHMYYPAMLDLSYFNIYLIGGGKVAFRKAKELVRCGGKIHIISKDLNPMFNELSGKFEYRLANYSDDILENATLVIAATNDEKLNEKIGIRCRKRGILCNVASAPHLSSFIVPASMRRGSLVISVSTEGKDPVLAKQIRMELEAYYSQEYGDYVEQRSIKRKEKLQKKKNN